MRVRHSPEHTFDYTKMASLGEDLLVTVNKLQDLVFNTIGSDSLDLPQIVSYFIYSIAE